MARFRAWRSWSRFCASLKAARLSNHLAPRVSAATPRPVRPSSRTTVARITAWVARVTVMTPKRNGRRSRTSRSKHSTASSLSLVMRASRMGRSRGGLFRDAGDIVRKAARRVPGFIHEHMGAHLRVDPQRAKSFGLMAVVEADLDDGRGTAVARLFDMHHRGLPYLHVRRLVGALDLAHQEERKNASYRDSGGNQRYHASRPVPPDEGVEAPCLVVGESHACKEPPCRQPLASIYCWCRGAQARFAYAPQLGEDGWAKFSFW